MADPGINKIDRFFDLVDSIADKADRVLNRTQQVETQHRARRSSSGGSSSAQARPIATEIIPRKYRLVEAIAPETGRTIFVVTNGFEPVECNSRGLAEKILHLLEISP